MRIVCLLAFLSLSSLAPSAQGSGGDRGDVVVIVHGLRNGDGFVNLALFRGPSGFPRDTDHALRQESVPLRGATSPTLTYTFRDVPRGEYAVAMMHDENENLELDTNFFGVPKEGYGFSNDARGVLGPPAYADCVFRVDGDAEVRIALR